MPRGTRLVVVATRPFCASVRREDRDDQQRLGIQFSEFRIPNKRFFTCLSSECQQKIRGVFTPCDSCCKSSLSETRTLYYMTNLVQIHRIVACMDIFSQLLRISRLTESINYTSVVNQFSEFRNPNSEAHIASRICTRADHFARC